MVKTLLWLDDLRNPFLDIEGKVPQGYDQIHWVLNYEQFVQYIEKFGIPNAISFDHDLADEHYTPAYFWDNYEESKKFQEWREGEYKEMTGKDCANWLTEYYLDRNLKYLPEIFVHSANPVGADNIRILLENFKKHLEKNA